MRNLTKEEASYITVTGKEFPFRSDIKPVKVKTMGEAKKMVEASKKPIVVIDDINYLFTREVFSADSKKNPFEIYDSLSKDFYHLVEAILNKDTEQNFYLMGHLENPDSEMRALKTLGQSTRKNNNPEGWTNIVFESVVELDEFVFKVKTDGSGVKSPIDMFEKSTVENDLKVINDKINKYYKGEK
jgi:hypothetical protein